MKDKYHMISHVWHLRKLVSQKLRVEWWLPVWRGWGIGGEKLFTGT
jgi:hypothetical protein